MTKYNALERRNTFYKHNKKKRMLKWKISDLSSTHSWGCHLKFRYILSCLPFFWQFKPGSINGHSDPLYIGYESSITQLPLNKSHPFEWAIKMVKKIEKQQLVSTGVVFNMMLMHTQNKSGWVVWLPFYIYYYTFFFFNLIKGKLFIFNENAFSI